MSQWRSRKRKARFYQQIDPDEFKFLFLLGDAAATEKLAMSIPANYSVAIVGKRSEETYRFNDTPIVRALMAIHDHYEGLDISEEERFSRSASVHVRISAMVEWIQAAKTRDPATENLVWVPDDKGEPTISDAVLHAAARAEVNTSGHFNFHKFLALVERLNEGQVGASDFVT